MDISSARLRLEQELRKAQPAILLLAKTFKEEGMSQLEMYRLYNEFRARHQDDTDETRCDAILDAMDCIVGWCTPDKRLFETYLQM